MSSKKKPEESKNKKQNRKAKPQNGTDENSSSSGTSTIAKPKRHWESFLESPQNIAQIPAVSYFKHAPWADSWEDMTQNVVGALVEIRNPYVKSPAGGGPPIMWVGTIIKFAGYKALVQYERFGLEPDRFVWISFCSDVPKPIGYSFKKKLLLYPEGDVAKKYPKFLDKLLNEVIRGHTTISGNMLRMFQKDMTKRQSRYPVRSKLEVMHNTSFWKYRVATVTGVVGDLIHVKYDTLPQDGGFVFSVHSDNIHPLGWAQAVGIEMDDPVKNPRKPISKKEFPAYNSKIQIEVRQILEARHPIDPYAICKVVIVTVLKHGYFVVAFRTSVEEDKDPLRYIFHITSPYIFPTGFAKRHNLTLWGTVERKNSRAKSAPLHLLPARLPHKFEVGHKFEVMDINDPAYLGPVTVERVMDHLLLLRFDGWPSDDPASQILMSADDPNMFPLGYANVIGYKFQEPES